MRNTILTTYFNLIRVYNALPVIIGFCISAALGHTSQPDLLLGSLVIVLLVGGITVWNDIEDQAIDSANGRHDGLQSGVVTGRQAAVYTIGLYAAALLVCFGLSRPLAGISLWGAYAVGGWLYNSRPLQWSRRPLSSVLLLAILYGGLPVAFGAKLHPYIGAFPVALLWGVQRFGIVIMKDYKDITGDRRHHKQTFLLRYGATAVAWASIVASLIAGAGLVLLLATSGHAAPRVVTAAALLAIVVVGNRSRLLRAPNTAARILVFERSFYLQSIAEGAVLLWVISH